ncbi:uncharacterized protein A4U43_C08F19150 [Asparagus officinalis]|nr:uncharacterized protein A4U43_C08F19150 [Asparagus officinalis]
MTLGDGASSLSERRHPTENEMSRLRRPGCGGEEGLRSGRREKSTAQCRHACRCRHRGWRRNVLWPGRKTGSQGEGEKNGALMRCAIAVDGRLEEAGRWPRCISEGRFDVRCEWRRGRQRSRKGSMWRVA